MYFNIPTQIEFISRYSTLQPGDLILTGTPSGIGPVRIGDNIVAKAETNGKILTEMWFNVEEKRI